MRAWLPASLLAAVLASGCAGVAIDDNYGELQRFAREQAASETRWLRSQAERDAMFAAKPNGAVRSTTYAALTNSRSVIITSEEHDVFGDGIVIVKHAPGHSEGHQVLYVKLARTGGVLVSPDPDDPHFFMVCSTKYDNDNIRRLELGAGSRVSTIRDSGTCS